MLRIIGLSLVLACWIANPSSAQDAEPLPATAPNRAHTHLNPHQDTVDERGAQTQLDEIVVIGQPTEDRAREFIGEIGAPSLGASAARWRRSVCIGVVNFDAEAARFLIDRVSAVAMEQGLQPGEPGCSPQVLVFASQDGKQTARQLVRDHRRLFRPGGDGFSRTQAALDRFVDTDRAVRWWHTSIPVDPRIARRARVLSNTTTFEALKEGDKLDNVQQSIVVPSLLVATTRHDLWRATVIVDFSRIGNVDYRQLADYIAFVALAQVDPEADVSAFSTILNIFEDASSTPQMTSWDRAYLTGLYSSDDTARGNAGREGEIRRAMLAVASSEANISDATATD